MDSKKKNPFTDLTDSGFIKIRMTTLSIAFEGDIPKAQRNVGLP